MSAVNGVPALRVMPGLASMGLSTLVNPSLFTMVSYLVGGVGGKDTRVVVLVGIPFFHTTDLLTPP